MFHSTVQLVRVTLMLLVAHIVVLHPAAKAQRIGLAGFLNPEGSRLFPQTLIFPRHSGKPDLRWRTFEWKLVENSVENAKYHLYFYQEELWTAEFTTPMINDQIGELIQVFNYVPSKAFSYLLFGSQRDFQQANIFNITEGVQGITSTTEATMAVPYWGEVETFRHVSTHELVHQFQVQKISDLTEGNPLADLSLFPLWFTEGMAEYYSLRGMDLQSRFYLRDLMLYPDEEKDYKMPKFFEEGTRGFIDVYKVGQAKVDFLEKVREGISQEIIEEISKISTKTPTAFKDVISQTLSLSLDQVEQHWQEYLKQTYQVEADHLSQSMEDYQVVPNSGENLDSFTLSPSGKLILIREINPNSGIVSLQLLDRDNKNKRIEIAQDHRSDMLSLYFMRKPTMALSDEWVAFLAESVKGPCLFFRKIHRNSNHALILGPTLEIPIYTSGLSQAESLTISPKNGELAFVGINLQGQQNIYTIPIPSPNSSSKKTFGNLLKELKQLTQGYYSWQDLYWNQSGILASSDKTKNQKYNIFQINPETKQIERITYSDTDQSGPDGEINNFVFQSWATGNSQLHSFLNGHEMQLTEAKTELTRPRFRNGELFALGFKSGRYHLYSIPGNQILNKDLQSNHSSHEKNHPWIAQLYSLPPSAIQSYRPFISSGIRVDSIAGGVGTGGFGGLSASVSDLMRNYGLTGDFAYVGDLRSTQADLFLTSNIGKTRWTLGAYHIIQFTLDNIFYPVDFQLRSYLRREFGALGALQYPLGAFSYLDTELRISGIGRDRFSDPKFSAQWSAINPGVEPLISPVFRLGFDSLLYELYTGPIRGLSILGELDTSYYPRRGTFAERARLDISHYIEVLTRTVLELQVIGGASWGDLFSNPFLISSDDILRAYSFGDNRLFGNYYIAANTEFQFPIGTLFKFEPLRGIIAGDIGSISFSLDQLRHGVTSSVSAGLSLNIPPLSISFVVSYPLLTAKVPNTSAVGHFTLRYLYL